MSVLVVPDEGGRRLFDAQVQGLGTGSWRVELFQSNTTPAPSTTFSQLTLATFSGYAAQTPAFGTATTVTVNNRNYDQITDTFQRSFVHNGGAVGNTIYGYVVYDASVNQILWLERFDFPVTLQINGDTIRVTAQVRLSSEN